MKSYSKYKKSNIEWLDKIPDHWDIGKLKNVSELVISSVDKHILEDQRKVLVCNYTDVYYNEFITSQLDLRIGSCSDEEYNKFKLKKGDVIITKDSETPNDIGVPSLVVDELDNVVCGYHLSIMKPFITKLIGGYLFRQLQTKRIRNYYEVCSNGITRFGLGKSSVLETPLIIPPISEQKQIVQYLDGKTELIDNLISIKERKIDLLKSQRTSLINEVMINGIEPNVKLKDSGVEWIGKIPEHWMIKPLKYVVRFNEKVLSETTDPNYELNYIEISDVDNSGQINNSTQYLFKDCPSRCRRILSKGDVIVSTVRTYLKSIGYIKDEVSDLICSTGFCVLTPKENILSNYLFFQVLTEYFIGEVISKSVGVSYPSITSTELVNIRVVIPPIQEQHQIVQFLNTRTKEIEDLVSMEQKKIDLLKEYRQSLISEVITGKIDVRTNLN